jgi:hypothetical protein
METITKYIEERVLRETELRQQQQQVKPQVGVLTQEMV